MDTPTLIAQAQAGDGQAIATLIAHSLRQHRVTVRAERHSYRLTLWLESDAPLDQALIVARIYSGLGRLGVTHIGTVLIHNGPPAPHQPWWSEEVLLLGAEWADYPGLAAPPPKPESALPGDSRLETAAPAARPQPRTTPARPPGTAHRPRQRPPLVIRASDFEPLRTAVILLVAVYGFMGSLNPGLNGPFMWLHFPDLAIHETGHLLFMPFGRFLYILGGSLTQIAFPAAFTLYFFISRQPFSAALTLFWTGQNFMDVGVYMRDAPYRLLPLTVDDPNAHDWYNLFRMTHSLDHAVFIANITHSIGVLLYLAAVGLGLYYARQAGLAEKVSPERPSL